MDETPEDASVASKPNTWMPLYVGDYLRKTMRLTTEQHGAYFLLLMACWAEDGSITADPEDLAATVRLPLDRWLVVAPRILPFFEERDGRLHNARLTEELTRAKAITTTRSEAGRAGAEARWQTDGKRMAKPLANAKQNDAPSQSQILEGSSEPPNTADKPKRATRLPVDWQPSTENRHYAISRGAKPEEITRDAEDFRDYWHARAGAGGAKLDWNAAWRTWCRNAADRRGRAPMASAPGQSRVGRQVAATFADVRARRRSDPPG